MDYITIDTCFEILVVGSLLGMGLELALSLAGSSIYKVLHKLT